LCASARLALSAQGAAVDLVKAVEEYERFKLRQEGEPVEPSGKSPQLKEAEELASLAKTEIESDFRLLHGHSLVGVWGALEAMASDLVLAWLINVPEVRMRPQVAGIKVSLVEFERLSSEERMHKIVRELDRASSSRAGIARFEDLLDTVMLSGSYDSALAQNIYEMQQIRNLFAHRRGVADMHFVTACPQLGLSVGEPVPLSFEPWFACLMSSISYTWTVVNRVNRHFGAKEIDEPPVQQLPFKTRPKDGVANGEKDNHPHSL